MNGKLKKREKTMVKLKQLDLSKGKEHTHPDISLKKSYLVKIGREWFAGKFAKEWFGLTFIGWYGTFYQYDTPGTNRSDWKEIYEIVEEERKKK